MSAWTWYCPFHVTVSFCKEQGENHHLMEVASLIEVIKDKNIFSSKSFHIFSMFSIKMHILNYVHLGAFTF